MQLQSLKVTARDEKAIAAIAESLRRRSGQDEPKFSTRQIIDVCYPGTIVTGREMPEQIHEMVLVDGAAFRSHRAPHIIFYSRRLTTDAQRYAIAHALAHIIFDGATGSCWRRNDDRERRCDAFADEVLVPLERLREYLSCWPSREPEELDRYKDQVDQIASHFHVPQRVVDRQIRKLWKREVKK